MPIRYSTCPVVLALNIQYSGYEQIFILLSYNNSKMTNGTATPDDNKIIVFNKGNVMDLKH